MDELLQASTVPDKQNEEAIGDLKYKKKYIYKMKMLKWKNPLNTK